DCSECLLIVCVEDEPGDIIFFIGNHRFIQKSCEWQISQRHLSNYPGLRIRSTETCQLISGAQRGSLCQQCAQVRKAMRNSANCVVIRHRKQINMACRWQRNRRAWTPIVQTAGLIPAKKKPTSGTSDVGFDCEAD